MANIDVTEYQIGENTYRYRDALIHEDLEGKVDKIEGYSLVPNTEITKLGTVEENANYIEVDDELSTTSENPVQNKVVKGAIDELQNLATRQQKGLVKVGDSLTIDGDSGSLDINHLATINPTLGESGNVQIATFTDNEGNTGSIYAPAGGGGGGSDVVITPLEVLGNKVKIAHFRVDQTEGDLWAPAGGDGQAMKDLIYSNAGSTAADITLTHSYKDYDMLYFTVIKRGEDPSKIINTLETSKLICPDAQADPPITEGDFFQLMGGSGGADWLKYEIADNNRFILDAGSQTVYVESIVGIKLGSYTLPIASDQTLGGVKVDGNGLTIDQNGVLAVDVDSAIDATSENPVQNKVIKTALDGKVDTNGTDRLMTAAEGTKLAGIATGAEVNVQADWNEADNTSDAYIANKPTIPAAQIQSDWNQSDNTSADFIKNKPAIPDTLDDLSDVSTTGVTSGQVLTYNGTGWEGTTPSAGTVTDVQVDSVSVVSGGVANISTMTGAGASVAGAKGLVPAPSAGDEDKFLAGDGTWKTGGGSGASALDDLTDVSIDDQTLDQGQILKYNGTAWVNDDESGGTTVVANPSGTATESLTKLQVGSDIYSISGGGASAIANLSDVQLTDLADKQVLRYNKTSQKWENVTAVLTIVDITQAEYNLLTPAEKTDPTIIYHIIDGEGEQGSINRYGYTDPTMVANDGDIYYLLDVNDKRIGTFLYKVNTWVLIEGVSNPGAELTEYTEQEPSINPQTSNSDIDDYTLIYDPTSE